MCSKTTAWSPCYPVRSYSTVASLNWLVTRTGSCLSENASARTNPKNYTPPASPVVEPKELGWWGTAHSENKARRNQEGGRRNVWLMLRLGKGEKKHLLFNNCFILHVLFFLNTQNPWSEGCVNWQELLSSKNYPSWCCIACDSIYIVGIEAGTQALNHKGKSTLRNQLMLSSNLPWRLKSTEQ